MDTPAGDAQPEEHDATASQDQDSWTSLILMLIHEHLQGARSPWKPYLDVLPQQQQQQIGTPMFWTEAELAELQASPVASRIGRDEAGRMIRSRILPVVRAHEDAFYPPRGEGQRLGDDALVALAYRMGSVIMAYAFDLEGDDGGGEGGGEDEDDDDEWVEDREGRTVMGMVPMADVLNADAEFNAHIEHGEEALTAAALRTIKKGEEVLNYYGPLSNGELLRRYGYVTVAHRRYNVVDLPWDMVLAELKRELTLTKKDWEDILGQVDEDELEESFIIDRGADDPDESGRVSGDVKPAGLPEELVEQLKALLKIVKKVQPDAVSDKTIRDKVIYSAVAKAMEARSKQYSTTLEQDRELYGDQNATHNMDRKWMAVDVRIGEKTLLQEASATAQARLAELAEADREDKPNVKRRRM